MLDLYRRNYKGINWAYGECVWGMWYGFDLRGFVGVNGGCGGSKFGCWGIDEAHIDSALAL